MDALPVVLFRWLHTASVVILIGGIFYARFFAGSFAPRFRPWIWITTVAILGSGLYNLLTKEAIPPAYHMWFGIKMLLVLHIFVVGLLITTRAIDDTKRLRMMSGIAASGFVVVMLSAYLRWISLT
jgi:hypothetical protein